MTKQEGSPTWPHAEYERRMRSVKRGVIRALGYTPDFTGVYISKDIEDEMESFVVHREGYKKSDREIDGNITWETIPLKTDPELPSDTVIYIWNEE